MEARSITQKALFIGQEGEGPMRGVQTLFVQGLVPRDLIEHAINQHKVPNVYFGAGRLSPFDREDVEFVLKNHPCLVVTVESNTEDLFELFKYENFYHMLPLCMESQDNTPSFAGFNVLAQYRHSVVVDESRVLLKIDSGSTVTVNRMQTCQINDYGVYDSDVLLWESDDGAK